MVDKRGRWALVGKRRRNHLEDLGVDGRIMLKWTSMRWDRVWNGSVCFRIGKGWRAFLNAVMNVLVS